MRCVSQWCQQLVECLNVWCKTWIIMDRANQTNSIVLDGPINRWNDRQLECPRGTARVPKLHQFTPPTRNTQGNIEDKRGKHRAGLAKAARQSALTLSRQNMKYLFFSSPLYSTHLTAYWPWACMLSSLTGQLLFPPADSAVQQTSWDKPSLIGFYF